MSVYEEDRPDFDFGRSKEEFYNIHKLVSQFHKISRALPEHYLVMMLDVESQYLEYHRREQQPKTRDFGS